MSVSFVVVVDPHGNVEAYVMDPHGNVEAYVMDPHGNVEAYVICVQAHDQLLC